VLVVVPLPQPVTSSPPADATTSHVDSFRIIRSPFMEKAVRQRFRGRSATIRSHAIPAGLGRTTAPKRLALVKGRMGPPKSRHGKRSIPLDQEMVSALRQLRKDTDWPGDEDLVFPAGNGQPLSQSNLHRDALKAPREEADLAWVGFHTFRHTCASMLFAEGRNAVQVQRWLGHHSPAFTLATYVHLLDGDLGEPLAVPSEGMGACYGAIQKC
jgi:hypothetical protein